MERVRFITHNGQRVLLLDYSNLQDESEMRAMIAERRRLIDSEPKNSVLTVADVTGAKYGREILVRIKESNVLDQPYVRRAAIVGVDDRQKHQVTAVETFSQHYHERFDTLAEALDWITSEPESATTGR